MTTVSRFYRQNDAGLRALTVLRKNLGAFTICTENPVQDFPGVVFRQARVSRG